MMRNQSIFIASHRAWLLIVSLCLVFFAILPGSASSTPQVSYRNHVVPVLSKAGCSTGPCHGNATGKGGFKMSLRSEDPGSDHSVLVRDWAGRRINSEEPEDSLLLLKATAQVAHEGGLRFRKDSEFYRVVRDWISEGALDDVASAPRLTHLKVTPLVVERVVPADQVQFSVLGGFSDGSERDVTSLAVYESSLASVSVSPEGRLDVQGPGEFVVMIRFLNHQVSVPVLLLEDKPGFAWKAPSPRNFIDEHVDRKLRRMKLLPSGVCSDSEFVRRAALDLMGILPTEEESRRFVEDPSSGKRERWVEQLLERPEFAEYWAMKWGDVLRNEEKTLDPLGVARFHRWLQRQIAGNRPVNEFVRTLVTAQGSTYANPESNYHRALRDPLGRAEAIAQTFLGARLQCARCHNHPFERWTQDEYYEWAANFSRIRHRVLENERRDGLDLNEFNGEQVVWMTEETSMINPRTGLEAIPRYLGEKQPAENDPRLEKLADWLVNPANPWFAKAQANRVWAHLMGRGLVDPVDDFRASNPGPNPELLEVLARHWIETGFDLKSLIRTVMNSRTYQAGSEPSVFSRGDVVNFSHAVPRRLAAEQILDAASQVTGIRAAFQGHEIPMRASQIPGGRTNPRYGEKDGDQFLAAFGKPQRLLACDCERTTETTMNQAFHLVSGPMLHRMLSTPKNNLAGWLDRGAAPAVASLYWTALSRPPTSEELKIAEGLLERSKDHRSTLEDLAWAVMNSKEFLFR
ncbi:MAG: DUF1553 domain-containing protein [Verrucomicrobia bacterium]|nr:DUF1553 domain-containing protein [Verrucomicrobiota bacterium]